MAIRQATELDMPLVDEGGEYITQWDDELGRLDFWLRIDPAKQDTMGQPVIDPSTGEEVIKDHWFDDDYQQVYMYHEYTEQEIYEDTVRKEQQERQERLEQSPDRIDDVEETQASTDEALCDLYEQLLAAQDTIQTQDDAVCELYEMILGTEE